MASFEDRAIHLLFLLLKPFFCLGPKINNVEFEFSNFQTPNAITQ